VCSVHWRAIVGCFTLLPTVAAVDGRESLVLLLDFDCKRNCCFKRKSGKAGGFGCYALQGSNH